jgi:hypothetical protein
VESKLVTVTFVVDQETGVFDFTGVGFPPKVGVLSKDDDEKKTAQLSLTFNDGDCFDWHMEFEKSPEHVMTCTKYEKRCVGVLVPSARGPANPDQPNKYIFEFIL